MDENYGKLAFVSLTNLNAPQFVNGLSCEVVYFANGSGICLQADRGVFTTYAATLFDSKFATRATFPLHGGPSRARVSPDGKIAAFTVFLSGHGYASLDFSTETLLVDTATGKVIISLEKDLKVTRDGKPFQAKDFNFWGVTFTSDSKHFYCTLSSAGAHHLIKGDIAARTAVVVHDNVECPSLSPDGTRVAYKKRFIIDRRLIWQLYVLDLATQRETPSQRSAASTTRSSGSITITFSTPFPIIPAARAGRPTSGKPMPPALARLPCFCRKLIRLQWCDERRCS